MMYRLTGGNYLHSSHEVPPSNPEIQEPEVPPPPPIEPPQEAVEVAVEKEAAEVPKLAEFEFG